MLKQVRETLADLRPRPIGPEGLVGDLRHQAEEFARLYSIRVEISTNGTEDMLQPAAARGGRTRWSARR